MLMFITILIAVCVAVPAAALIADCIAPLIAACYWTRYERLAGLLVAASSDVQPFDAANAWKADRARGRLMSRNLSHALHMTEYFSAYPDAGPRGHACTQVGLDRAVKGSPPTTRRLRSYELHHVLVEGVGHRVDT